MKSAKCILGYRRNLYVALNASVDGASSAYIVGTAGLLAAKCAAIKASGAKVTLVRFGHNDSKIGVALSKEVFKTNMQTTMRTNMRY